NCGGFQKGETEREKRETAQCKVWVGIVRWFPAKSSEPSPLLSSERTEGEHKENDYSKRLDHPTEQVKFPTLKGVRGVVCSVCSLSSRLGANQRETDKELLHVRNAKEYYYSQHQSNSTA